MGDKRKTGWTEARIEEKLLEAIRALGSKHFPTHSELANYFNNKALAVAVTKHGGTKYWAEKLNMPIKDCESSWGNKFEEYAINDIKHHTGLDSIITIPRFPYDVYTADCIKIDIKASLPIKEKKFSSWTFNLEKKMPTCDIFIFYCVGDDKLVKKTCVIPSVIVSGQTQLGIGTLSKYDSFIDRWDIITDYYEFYMLQKSNTQLLGRRKSN